MSLCAQWLAELNSSADSAQGPSLVEIGPLTAMQCYVETDDPHPLLTLVRKNLSQWGTRKLRVRARSAAAVEWAAR